MTNTKNTSNNTTAAYEDQAVKGKASSAEAIFGNIAKPMFSRGGNKSPLKTALTALLLVFLFALPIYLQGMGEALLLAALVGIGLYVILALGLNIVVGYAGMLDFGRMAFYAVGTYAAIILAIPLANLLGDSLEGLVFPLVMVAAGLIAAFVGWLLSLPVMRLRGDYLAIVTLGFGEIVRITIQNNPFGLTNGLLGLPDRGNVLASPPFFDWLRDNVYWALGNDFFFTMTRNVYWYYMVLIMLIVAIIVVRNQDNSRLGRSWAAMREDEVAASAMGVNVTKAKTWAFVLGAFWGGIAGACFGFFLGGISPEPFSFLNSVIVLAIVVIGGMGSIPGVLVGGVLIMGFPELVRWFAMNHLGQAGGDIQSMVANFRNLFLGLLMVVMMAVRTEGIIPMKPKFHKLFGKGKSDKGDHTDAVVGAAPKGGAGS
ncbi:MAG: branched-chain amino acid ABC transporter permease [Coriobacteriia bacterium]|nr:branched-chain amino acid ABC transporter permease [Coriobacteriia bacterium]MCL2870201.1 branched-chain amino acid ABC transporter permease [Coriobacteriia bacterium]